LKRLDECPSVVACTGRRWEGTLVEAKKEGAGGIRAKVTADRPFSLHLLDDPAVNFERKRCDGLLVAETPDPGGLTCFIELKGSLDRDNLQRPFDQIVDAATHFAPAPGGPAHGEEHHVAWRAADDLPVAPRGRGRASALAVGKEHKVGGVVLVSRGGARVGGEWRKIAGRDVFIAVVQRHGVGGLIEIELDELEQALGD
jgi:hypothetical protein